MTKNDVFISQGVRPIWHLIIAATCYTLVVVCAYQFYSDLFPSTNKLRHFNVNWIYVIIMLLFYAIKFSLVYHYYFDFEKKKYKIEKTIGPIKMGKWKEFKKLNYVSVFKNTKELYEVNLWYNKNKHFNIVTFDEYNEGLKIGKEIATKMKLELFDATTKSTSN